MNIQELAERRARGLNYFRQLYDVHFGAVNKDLPLLIDILLQFMYRDGSELECKKVVSAFQLFASEAPTPVNIIIKLKNASFEIKKLQGHGPLVDNVTAFMSILDSSPYAEDDQGLACDYMMEKINQIAKAKFGARFLNEKGDPMKRTGRIEIY